MTDDARRDDPEGRSFGGMVRRYARTTSAVGGLAARMAGERYLGWRIDRDRHARELTEALGGIKGPLMKLGQIMATIPDALPAEYVEQMQQLQANAPPMGWLFVKRRMATELGPDWQQRYASFERAAAHAASLGQVHRATVQDGRTVACKLQYPDMESAVEADLRQLRLAASIWRRYDPAVQPENIVAEISERLREELDYIRELKAMRLYSQMLESEPGVHIPEPVEALSTRRLLTMTWLSGERLMAVKDRPIERRNRVAHNMFRAWYVPFYFYGVIHGDPHLGNYTVRDDDSVNLLDFGCIRIFPPSFVSGVIDLYRALRDGNRDLAVHAYETWGFENLSDELIDVLNIWAEFVYSPLMQDSVRRIQESDSGLYGAQVATRVHKELRRVGGVRPPREFVLMDRAAIGLGSVFMHLKAEINWYRLFHDLIEGFDVGALEERQRAALAEAGL